MAGDLQLNKLFWQPGVLAVVAVFAGAHHVARAVVAPFADGDNVVKLKDMLERCLAPVAPSLLNVVLLLDVVSGEGEIVLGALSGFVSTCSQAVAEAVFQVLALVRFKSFGVLFSPSSLILLVTILIFLNPLSFKTFAVFGMVVASACLAHFFNVALLISSSPSLHLVGVIPLIGGHSSLSAALASTLQAVCAVGFVAVELRRRLDLFAARAAFGCRYDSHAVTSHKVVESLGVPAPRGIRHFITLETV